MNDTAQKNQPSGEQFPEPAPPESDVHGLPQAKPARKSRFTKKVYETRKEKEEDFAIGAGIFIGMNVLLFILMASGSLVVDCLFPLTFLVNIAVLIYFILTRTWIGIGMLGTFGFLLVLGTVLGIIASVVCFYMNGSSGI